MNWITDVKFLSDETFISSSADRFAKIWQFDSKIKKYKLIKTIKDHQGTIHGMLKISDKLLATYSQDGTTKLYNIEDRLNPVLIGSASDHHTNSVTKAESNGRLLATYSFEDHSVSFRDLVTF